MEKANTDEDSHESENILKEKIESAKKKLDVAKNTNNKDGEGDAYCELTELWYKYGDYEKSIEYGAELVKIAKNVGKIEWEIAAYDVLGWSYYNKENYKQSIKYGNDELSIATKSRRRVEEGCALKILAWSYYFEKEYTQSIEYGNQLLTIAKEIGKREDIINANEILADAYNATGKHKKANEHRKEQKALEKGTEAAAAGESPNYSSESSQDGEREKESAERGLEKRSDSGDFKETKEEETDEARGRFPNGSSSETPQDGERENESTERGLEKQSDSGDSKETKEGETDEAREKLLNGSSPVVPREIEAWAPGANVASKNELDTRKVKLNRARIILIGQDQAGKTSLKNSLFGPPFESEEESTKGSKVDPTVFDIDVKQVKNWPHSDDERIAATEVKEEQPNDIKMNEGPIREDKPESITPKLNPDSVPSPEEDTDVLVQYLRGVNLQSDTTSVEKYTLEVWDFAGQHLYYAFYPVFLSPRAVYLLVYDLSKDLKAIAPPWVRKELIEEEVQNENSETNLENLLSWLASVSTLCYTETDVDENSTKELSYLRPPIFIVGTHADEPHQKIKEMEKQIQNEVIGARLDEHLIRPVVSVDNNQGLSGGGLAKLQEKINEVLMEQPYMGEEVPLRWLNFEKVVQALVASKQVYYLKLEQLQTIIQKVCFIEDKDEVTKMLDLYHNLGIIVKHRNTVVLQAQWLIGVFKQLIALPDFNQTKPKHGKLWKALQDTGVLSIELVKDVFPELCPIKEDILDMMEQFGLIAKFATSSIHENYFVPCQLKTPPGHFFAMEPSPSDPLPLYLRFELGFVPHGFFSQLVSEFTISCFKSGFSEGFTMSPYFYDKVSKFVIKKTFQHHLVMLCKKGIIKIVLKQETPECSKSSAEIEEVANTVRQSLENAMQSLTSKLPWLKDLKTDWCACSNKYQKRDCLCLHKILEEGKLEYCGKCHIVETKTLPRLEKWFSMKATVPSTTEASLPTLPTLPTATLTSTTEASVLFCPSATVPSTSEASLPTLPTATLTIATSSRPVTAPAAIRPSTGTFQQPVTAPAATKPSTETFQQPAPCLRKHPGTEKIYNMTENPRGKALIVNNFRFDKDPDNNSDRPNTRHGSKNDVRRVGKLFNDLGFQVHTKEDLEKQTLLNDVYEFADMDDSAYDCFVLWLMSHGSSGGQVTCADRNMVSIQSIQDQVLATGKLKGKPKLFFIQACRGNEEYQISPDAHSPALPEDFLFSYATVDDHVSYRDEEKGTYYVTALVEVFRQNAANDDLLSMLTKVTKRVSEMVRTVSKPGNETKSYKQIPEVKHNLKKKLYF